MLIELTKAIDNLLCRAPFTACLAPSQDEPSLLLPTPVHDGLWPVAQIRDTLYLDSDGNLGISILLRLGRLLPRTHERFLDNAANGDEVLRQHHASALLLRHHRRVSGLGHLRHPHLARESYVTRSPPTSKANPRADLMSPGRAPANDAEAQSSCTKRIRHWRLVCDRM